MYRDINWEGMACEYDCVKPIRDTDKGRLYLSKPFLLCIQPTSRVQQGVTQVLINTPYPSTAHWQAVRGAIPSLLWLKPIPGWLSWPLRPCLVIIYLLYLSYSRPGLLLFHAQIGFGYTVELEQVEALVFLKERFAFSRCTCKAQPLLLEHLQLLSSAVQLSWKAYKDSDNIILIAVMNWCLS